MDLAQMFILDKDRLEGLAQKYRSEFSEGKPFPHVVIDDFLPEHYLKDVINEFPTPDQVSWQTFNNAAERKIGLRDETQIGPKTRLLLYQLNSAVFINFLELLTGIDGLIPDPYFGGGGLHQIERDGFLKIHADFNWHPKLQLDRRLNLLIYLNEYWEERYGGHLEFWDKEMTRCEKRVLPIFNRCVVFSTTDFSHHGHPEPLNCPPGRTRKSLALYYYTNGRPPEEKSPPHTTFFRGRPGELLPVSSPPFSSQQTTDEGEKTAHALSSQLAERDAQMIDAERKIQDLSSQLAEKQARLDSINRSLGWRLLGRYGRIKYRYLLPFYRVFRPAPSDGIKRKP